MVFIVTGEIMNRSVGEIKCRINWSYAIPGSLNAKTPTHVARWKADVSIGVGCSSGNFDMQRCNIFWLEEMHLIVFVKVNI